MPQDVCTPADLNAVLERERAVVIDFWAPWCGPCKVTGPQFAAAAERYGDEPVAFVKCDTESCPQLAQAFGIRALPTVVFMLDGEVADVKVGAIDAGRLAKKVDWLLAKARGEGFFSRLFSGKRAE